MSDTTWVHPTLRDCQLKDQRLSSENGKRRDAIRARVADKYPVAPRVPDKAKSGLKF